SRTESDYDRVLLVVAPEEARVRRWVARGGDDDDARLRMAAQISADAARDRVHDVLVNDGSLEDLRRKVTELYDRWIQ
ncbi:MAG TPA: dephospho-CoA kinase, partial [Thermoanaerobaculia bacterium]